MEEPTVYVVMGQTGEYSDARDWLVAAYLEEAKAQTHVRLAEAWYRERAQELDANRYRPDGFGNPYDPCMQTDYTGTQWFLVEVPLRSETPNDEVKA